MRIYSAIDLIFADAAGGKQEAVRRRLPADERLVAVELAHGSGVILATRRI
ncbi:hypothetical protein ACIBHX_31345 [Nonomuraea sp. NPDC050536]|uniref:hypothetical protein n=1 Tax=Nonomuraea sp. NPDC050536 TaxID=3364366 RepID=UPI0037C8C290